MKKANVIIIHCLKKIWIKLTRKLCHSLCPKQGYTALLSWIADCCRKFFNSRKVYYQNFTLHWKLFSKTQQNPNCAFLQFFTLNVMYFYCFSFQFRENRTEHWAGANCNQIIMLFSDGGTEEAWEVLEKYNFDKSVSNSETNI